MKYLFILLVMIAISGCGKKAKSVAPSYTLSVTERTKLNLPQENVLTLATKEDIDFAASLNAAIIKDVRKSLNSTDENVAIKAARPIGDYLLLWISFPNVRDGGVDLIWSVKKQKVIGEFLGGYRG